MGCKCCSFTYRLPYGIAVCVPQVLVKKEKEKITFIDSARDPGISHATRPLDC